MKPFSLFSQSLLTNADYCSAIPRYIISFFRPFRNKVVKWSTCSPSTWTIRVYNFSVNFLLKSEEINKKRPGWPIFKHWVDTVLISLPTSYIQTNKCILCLLCHTKSLSPIKQHQTNQLSTFLHTFSPSCILSPSVF